MKPILQDWLASSTDPSQISAKITGIILSFSSAIVFVALNFFHVTLSGNDVSSLATGLGMVGGAVWFIFGLIRHVAVKVGTVH